MNVWFDRHPLYGIAMFRRQAIDRTSTASLGSDRKLIKQNARGVGTLTRSDYEDIMLLLIN